MKPIDKAMQELEAVEAEVIAAREALSEIHQEYSKKIKPAEARVSIAQAKLSAVIAIVRTLRK